MSTNKQLSQEYKGMVAAAAKMAFITAVRRSQESTLTEVVAMAEKEGLGNLTIGEVFFDKVEFGSGAFKALPEAGSSSKRRSSITKVEAEPADTRTPAARASYEKELLDSMRAEGHWVSAADLRKRVGGTPLQARKALNRLIEQSLIKFKGKARATKYRVRRNKSKQIA